jgi:predicted GNAT family N-acyltransferase
MIFPDLEVIIQPNHVSVRNLDSGHFASAEAPFSCSHLLVDDVDILEHACHQLLKEAVSATWFSFPRVKVSTAGRPIHNIERKIIRDALQNAGARQVVIDPSIQVLDEQPAIRSAYIEKAKRKR